MFRNLKKKTEKKFQECQRAKKKVFSSCPTFVFDHKMVYNSCFLNQHFAQITFPCMLWNGLSPHEISKVQHQNSNYNCLLELQKLALGI